MKLIDGDSVETINCGDTSERTAPLDTQFPPHSGGTVDIRCLSGTAAVSATCSRDQRIAVSHDDTLVASLDSSLHNKHPPSRRAARGVLGWVAATHVRHPFRRSGCALVS